MALSSLALSAASPLGQLDVAVENLRSAEGLIQVCLTRDAAYFPDCEHDPAARHLTTPAAAITKLSFAALPSGTYAVALFHDENGNGRLDKRFGIPTEGFGFSRNPQLMFGPPAFAAAGFAVDAAETGQVIQMRYLL